MRGFLGIARERVFSPGRVEDDRAILETVAARVRRSGRYAAVCSADDSRWPVPAAATVVFTMAQGASALARLRAWQMRGIAVINAPVGIRNCQRHRTLPILRAAGVPFPESRLVDTAAVGSLPSWIDGAGVWVKRGDVHATAAGDVVAADDADGVTRVLAQFRERGIRRALIQRHVAGTVVKFYAVRGRFFHHVTPPGGRVMPASAARRLRAIGEQAAAALQVDVYGGDCVYAMNGELRLIDLNDWPSYAPCRAEAAEAIAAYLIAQEVASDT